MPYSIGQWTGLVVTTIIVLGCDLDIVYAMPLGILAGALATFFVTLADARLASRNPRRSPAESNSTRLRAP